MAQERQSKPHPQRPERKLLRTLPVLVVLAFAAVPFATGFMEGLSELYDTAYEAGYTFGRYLAGH